MSQPNDIMYVLLGSLKYFAVVNHRIFVNIEISNPNGTKYHLSYKSLQKVSRQEQVTRIDAKTRIAASIIF